MHDKIHLKVDLIFEATCPNVELARRRLRSAFNEVGLVAHWNEWDISDPGTPGELRQFGSPTILVNGHDVSPAKQGDAESCRLYLDSDGKLDRAPTITSIVRSLTMPPPLNGF